MKTFLATFNPLTTARVLDFSAAWHMSVLKGAASLTRMRVKMSHEVHFLEVKAERQQQKCNMLVNEKTSRQGGALLVCTLLAK